MLSRSDWVSIAATLLVAGTSYFISGPKAAIVCVVIGTLIFLALHFGWNKSKPESESIPNVRIEDSLKNENRLHIEVNPHIEIKPSFEQHNRQSAELSTEPQMPKAVPNLVFLPPPKTIRMRRGIGSAGFYESDDKNDPYAIIACFRNDNSSVSKKVAPAYDVRAWVLYRNNSGQEIGIGISEACWMGDPRRINFLVGESQCVILAVLVGTGELNSPYIHRTRNWMGPGFLIETYPLETSLKSIELRLIRGNDLLLDPFNFDFSIIDGRPVIKQRQG